jgi:poly-gamma-glutamate synthesis protein (capsule biosynthesis protein)
MELSRILTFFLCLVLGIYSFWDISIPRIYYHSIQVPNDVPEVIFEPVTITFVGDILLARHVENLMVSKGKNYPFSGLNFSSSTYLFGNLESSIPTTHVNTPIRSIKFSTPQWAIPAITEAGFTHLSLANNHSYDFGRDGFVNTQNVLKEHKLEYFGHPHEVGQYSTSYIEIGTSTIAVTGINFLNTRLTDSSISYLRSVEMKSDFQIAYVHWGQEYVTNAGMSQKEQAKLLIQEGFDLIIGHHPHVVQNIEVIDGVVVVYSLGNYIFDQYFSKDVQTGLIAHLNIGQSGANLILEPVTSLANLSKPQTMSPQEQDYFLKELAVSSSIDLLASITRGELSLASFDEKVIMDDIKLTYVQ